jgi:hypothetical protein
MLKFDQNSGQKMEKPEISNYIKKDPSELTTGEILIGYQKYAKALEKYIEDQLHIHDVVWRSKQLKAYAEFLQTRPDFQECSNKDLAIDYCDSIF